MTLLRVENVNSGVVHGVRHRIVTKDKRYLVRRVGIWTFCGDYVIEDTWMKRTDKDVTCKLCLRSAPLETKETVK